MAMTKTEREIKAARKLLGDARIIAFLRAALKGEECMAITIANAYLDKGQSLDDLLHPRPVPEGLEGSRFGAFIGAKTISKDSFNITYGHEAGGQMGDGGVWVVTFAGNAVKAITRMEFWVV